MIHRSTLPLIATLTLVLWSSACSRPEKLNVVIVTLDTTRADHLGCYGDTRARTPMIDDLAAGGVRFAHAYSSVPITAPSHSSILTGTWPMAHGVRDNGLFVLGDANETLAEILGAQGWATAAAVGSYPVTSQFGFSQGFDYFNDHLTQKYEDLRGERVEKKVDMYFDERPAGWVVDALTPWLEKHSAEPFFIWAHFFDPHYPHQPPAPYDQLYLNDPYRGEIAYADESVGKLLGHLDRLGVLEKTIVVIVADHGEGNGEHHEVTHSMLIYDTTIHVPLIMRVPGESSGRVVDQRVATIDIAPTILDLVGVATPEAVQGQSLVPLMGSNGSDALAPDRAIYCETLSPRLSYQWGEQRGLIKNDHKLIYGPRVELYDLHNDPDELEDLSEEMPELTAQLTHELATFIVDHAVEGSASHAEIDEEARQRLMALGYIHETGGEAPTIQEILRSDGIAPQDRVGDVNASSRARQLLFQGQFLEAQAVAKTLVERNPENPVYVEMLASSQIGAGQLEEAFETINRLRGIEQVPDAGLARVLLNLATEHYAGGDLQSAMELASESQDLIPSASGHYLLASILARSGNSEAEERVLVRALEIDPAFAPARVDLAVRHAMMGDRDLAAAEFHRVLASQPYYARAHYNYAAFLIEGSDLEQATRHLERAVELNPSYAPAWYALIALSYDAHDMNEARAGLDSLLRYAPESTEAERARRLLEESP